MSSIKSKEPCTCVNCGTVFYPFISSYSLFCCHKCSCEYKSKTKYEMYLRNPSQYYGKQIDWIKPIILKEQNYKCAICGMPNEWNGKPLVFILDHIDGHAFNNVRENLRLVCSNCDSQLDTYKSKNKHSDRVYYTKNIRGNWEVKEKQPYNKEEHLKEQPTCYICGAPVKTKGHMCPRCSHKKNRRVEWPTREELKTLIRNFPFTVIGAKFQVSDVAVHNWCKHYGLPHSAYAIKKMTDEEWEKV